MFYSVFSHCSQHSWKRSKYNPTKKSIFALPEQVQEEDEAAGDDDDMVDSFNMRGNTFINQVSDVNKMLSQCQLSDMKRPKTELDSPYSRINTPGAHTNEPDVEFPTIKNNVKAKGRGFPVRREKTNLGLDSKRQGNYEKVTPRNGDGELNNCNKDQAQLTLSGSLNELGRKGLYLKDLVDSQKAEGDICEDVEEDIEVEDDREEFDEAEEFDYDDDYFIFANDDDSDDDEQVLRQDSEKQDHSGEGSVNTRDEHVESNNETDKGDDKEKVLDRNTNASSNEKVVMDQSSSEENITKDQNKKMVNVIETILPFGPEERSKSVNRQASHENVNQNANPKVAEKHQSKEKPRGQFLKASIITVVSKPEVSAPALLSGSQGYCTSNSQASSSNGSQGNLKAGSSSTSLTKPSTDSQTHLKAGTQINISENQTCSTSSANCQASSQSENQAHIPESQTNSSFSNQELFSSDSQTSNSESCQTSSSASIFPSGSKSDKELENKAQSNENGTSKQTENQSSTGAC